MTGPVFADTNVFVYRHDNSVPSRQSRTEQWIVVLAPVLLTEDLQEGHVFDGVTVVDPFASPDRTPQEVLEAHEAALSNRGS